MHSPRLYFWFLILPAVCSLFAGCKSVAYGSAVTSAAVANELIRYTLPELKNIDRIEVTEYHTVIIDRKFLDYYEAHNQSQSSYISILDEPVDLWTNPARPAATRKQKFNTHGSSTIKTKAVGDPQAVSEFVGIFNANRSLWLSSFDLAPESPYAYPYSYTISFFSQNVLVRTIGFRKNILRTSYELKSIIRRLSDTDTLALERLLSPSRAH
ncbi:MAG: hypothetical protein KKF58_06310 [Gammaproteobacteria bacterium]|nr:hypothetical protein [Gammaproteobacteria bacterium]MBU1447906.1 hypothetical protein [Gammaproteobacteria bacterium]